VFDPFSSSYSRPPSSGVLTGLMYPPFSYGFSFKLSAFFFFVYLCFAAVALRASWTFLQAFSSPSAASREIDGLSFFFSLPTTHLGAALLCRWEGKAPMCSFLPFFCLIVLSETDYQAPLRNRFRLNHVGHLFFFRRV